jgi:type IV pilus assembly protein PilO
MNISLVKLPWYAQVGAFLGLSLVALAGFYFLYVSPTRADMASQQQKLDALRAEIAKSLAVARQLPEFRTQVAELEGRLEGLKAVLPEEKDVADLLRRIQTLAVQSNLTITGFKPGAVVTRELHAEWPITLDLDGNYHNLGTFFDRISKFSRIINIDGVTIRAKDKPEGTSTITAECVATTFVLLESAKTPPAQPAGAAKKGS